MNEITWKIEKLLVESKVEDLNKVVREVHWSCRIQDEQISDTAKGVLQVQLDREQPFTQFQDLTPEQVWGWVYATVNKEAVEAELVQAVDAAKNPQFLHLTPPWEQA